MPEAYLVSITGMNSSRVLELNFGETVVTTILAQR